MKRLAIRLSFVLALAVLVGLGSGLAAEAPAVAITGPSGTIYVPAFPYNTTIDMTIGHSNLNSISNMKVEVSGAASATIFDTKPFADQDCSAELIAASAHCATSGSPVATQAEVKLKWSVPVAGLYTITVSTTHGNEHGTDSGAATFVLQMVTVEYPAPPAVANGYLNTLKPLPASTVRGCVISQIAANAQEGRYGDRPGPYNVELIHADVDYLLPGCTGKKK
jgi:hypothetical protein